MRHEALDDLLHEKSKEVQQIEVCLAAMLPRTHVHPKRVCGVTDHTLSSPPAPTMRAHSAAPCEASFPRPSPDPCPPPFFRTATTAAPTQ